MQAGRADIRFRIASAVGIVGLILWAALWLKTFHDVALPLGDRMWLKIPFLGADFWSQSALAAQLWLSGVDPYASQQHLLPYPPIVIRLFVWVHFFSLVNAMRVYFVAMVGVAIAAVVVAYRTRRRLGLSMPPFTVCLFAVIASYPFLFQFERENCDLITVLTILIALPLLARRNRATEFLAGALLSIGPWVKIYPALLGFGLLALRRFWAVLGFAVGGAAIFLSMPAETKHSLKVLGRLMAYTRAASMEGEYPIWSHSLSHAWLLIFGDLSQTMNLSFVTRTPEVAAVGVAALAAIAPLCIRVFLRRDAGVFTYPLLLWVCAVASFVPIIANDYSLVFYPLTVLACADIRDPWAARLGIASSLLTWQPFVVPISPWIVLASKLFGVAGVGVSLWHRVSQAGAPDSQARV